MIYLDLILNLSLLVALSVVSGFIEQRWPRQTRFGVLVQGALFGAAAVIGMLHPLQLAPGLIFDGRSVMVSLCALFFGPWSGAIAAAMTIACRIGIGGVGTTMGVTVILSSAAMGLLAYHYLKPHRRPLSTANLYLFGIAVHLAMLALLATLPAQTALNTLRHIGLPVILLYPLATVLVGKILSDQQSSLLFIADLQATKQNLDITLQSIGDAVISADLAGRIVLMNPVAEMLTGWKREEAVSRPIAEILRIVDAKNRRPLEQSLEKVLAAGKIAEQSLLIARDGTERQIADSAAPMRDDSGRMIGMVLVFRDITEEYRSRDALRQSDALLRIAGRTARLGGWIVNATEDSVIWSDEAAAIHDRPPGYTSTVSEAMQFFVPECRERIRKVFSDCLRKGRSFDEELQMITSQGRRIWVRAIGEAIYDEAGAITTVQGSLQDITEKKGVEEALRESQEDYRKLFQDHAAVKLIIDPREGTIVDANMAAEAYYGWSREELRQMPVRQINTVSPEVLRQAMNNVLTRKRVHFEFQHRRADGSVRDVAIFSSRIKMKGAYYIHAIVHDISERKKAEEENLKLQNQFMQAQKMESIGRLAGGVAHDFNNMLAVIIGRAELALSTLEPAEPIHEDLEEIRKAANRSADLTRQLLAFARKQTIAPVVLDLNETIERMLKMLRRMIGEDIDLFWRPAANLWAIKMDPAQIDQILANLVVNARDAVCGVGKMTIETDNVEFDESYCETHTGFTPGQYALLAVSDDGCGMEKTTLAKLFEPFFTTKPSGEGTGLGLSTVYGIVKQNNGFINVYSEPDQGTIFKIYLPRATSAETIKSAKQEGEPARGTETVLLVEDEEPILELGKMILERYGYIVLAAKSPSEALALEETHQGPLQILITDVVMPEMNGKALRNKIKALRPEIKTLFVSGYTANVIAHHGVLDDSVEYLQKPFSVKTMAAKVREVLDRPADTSVR
jgi:PAS domain S-box-containing protein